MNLDKFIPSFTNEKKKLKGGIKMADLKAFRIKELTQILGVSKESIYKWIREKKFPAPRKIGGRVSIWLKKDIEKWLEGGGQNKNEGEK